MILNYIDRSAIIGKENPLAIPFDIYVKQFTGNSARKRLLMEMTSPPPFLPFISLC